MYRKITIFLKGCTEARLISIGYFTYLLLFTLLFLSLYFQYRKIHIINKLIIQQYCSMVIRNIMYRIYIYRVYVSNRIN